MYENGAMLAVFLLIYSAVAGRIERSLISGPIVFTAAGFILGADGLGILRIHIDGEGLRILAELTLAMVLFTDAANADFSIVKRNLDLPKRLLLIGLPLTIVLGFVVAAVIFPQLEIFGNGPVGGDVGADRRGAGRTGRDQSGGAAGDARGAQSGKRSQRRHLRADRRLVARTSGRHADRGRDCGACRSGGRRGNRYRADRRACVDLADHVDAAICRKPRLDQRALGGIPIVALAAACFAAAQAAGGSGFIACFVGGLLLSGLRARHKEELLRGAAHMGEALALLTWVVFGGIVVARMIDRITWPALLYAMLSLTVVRMLPVFLCLIGTRTSTADKLFIGWFGPRGLATIVFAVLVLDEKLPGNDTIMLAAGWTVLLSVIAHGVTANPLVRRIATRASTQAEDDLRAAG